MNNWESAANKIRRRPITIWNEIDISISEGLDLHDEGNFIATALYDLPLDDPELVLSFPDRDRLWLTEILFSAQKFSHVARLAKKRAEEGAVTWAATDAHHAVLLGVRAFLATLGVCICEGKARSHLVDFRPEKGSVDEAKKFRKTHGSVDGPTRVLSPRKQLVEQKDLFKLLERALNVVETVDDKDDLVNNVKILNLGSHKAERNRLLYQGDYWHWKDDITWPTIDVQLIEEYRKGVDGNAKDFVVLKRVSQLVLSNLRPLAEQISVWDDFFQPIHNDPDSAHDPLSFLPS